MTLPDPMVHLVASLHAVLICALCLQPGKVQSHSAQFWREADMLASLNHPSVLHLYGVVVDNHHDRNVVGIMTEYMRGGSLSAALR